MGSPGHYYAKSSRFREVVDRRSRLFTIFMGNLSKRVSRRALWEAISEYGKVVDVYIPRANNRPAKGYTFAFVRYKLEFEM